MFVLSYTLPPVNGAAFGKATVLEPDSKAEVFDQVSAFMTEHFGSMGPVNVVGSLAHKLATAPTGTIIHDPSTGADFRIDPEERAPHACPCCDRLVEIDEGGAFAGHPDAYCGGCYTWDRNVPGCLPENTCHPNPWTIVPRGARWCMDVVIDIDGSTGYDHRYSATDDHQIWDDEVNARIAWPGLRPEQFIEITIAEINKES
jgi:hypothetical protein